MELYIMMGILLQLMQNKKLTASKLAQQYEVSTRSIYRYIDSLSAYGVPICTTSGRNGGISILSPINLENLFFTKEELLYLRHLISDISTPKVISLSAKIDYLILNNY